MQFPHMSSCCDVAGKTTRRALWTNFEENFTTPSPRYDYTFNMIFRIWNLEPFHIITHFMLVITHYFTEYTFILYCNANAKYCIFVQLRCTTSRSFLPRPSGTDKGLAEASAKKRILQNALNLYQNTYIICRFIGFYWCVIEALGVSGITKVLFSKRFSSKMVSKMHDLGCTIKHLVYIFVWVSVQTVFPVVQLEVFERRRVFRVGDSVSRKALRRSCWLCSSEMVCFLFILRLVNLGLTNYGFTGILHFIFWLKIRKDCEESTAV